jgi:hypothetical protein
MCYVGPQSADDSAVEWRTAAIEIAGCDATLNIPFMLPQSTPTHTTSSLQDLPPEADWKPASAVLVHWLPLPSALVNWQSLRWGDFVWMVCSWIRRQAQASSTCMQQTLDYHSSNQGQKPPSTGYANMPPAMVEGIHWNAQECLCAQAGFCPLIGKPQ